MARDLSMVGLPLENFPTRVYWNGLDIRSTAAVGILIPGSPLYVIGAKIVSGGGVGAAVFWKRELKDFFGDEGDFSLGFFTEEERGSGGGGGQASPPIRAKPTST